MRLRAPGFRLGAANHVAFSPSGKLLGQVGRRVALFSVAERREIRRSDWHFPHPAYVTFDSSDRWFAVRSTTGAIVVSEVATGQPLSRLAPMSDTADDSPLLTGPTDAHLVEACTSGVLRVRRVEDLAVEYSEQHATAMLGRAGHTVDRRHWAFAVNVKRLAAPTQPPCRIELREWPLDRGTRRTLGDSFGFIEGLAMAPSGERLALLERRESKPQLRLSIISAISGSIERTRAAATWRAHRGFAWSPDGAWIVIGTDEGHELVNASTLGSVGCLAGEYSSDAAFSPDGTFLALGRWGRGLVLPTCELSAYFREAARKGPESAH